MQQTMVGLVSSPLGQKRMLWVLQESLGLGILLERAGLQMDQGLGCGVPPNRTKKTEPPQQISVGRRQHVCMHVGEPVE